MTFPAEDQNIAQTIADIARKPQALTETAGGTLFAVPDGFHLKTDAELRALQQSPHRHDKGVKLNVVASFIEYANIHKRPESLIYASVNRANAQQPLQLTAVFNEHTAGLAGWRDFRAVVTPEPSHEWLTWCGQHGKSMSQADFATFIDDNLKDIATVEGHPTGTMMLELATKFEVSQDKRIRSSIRQQSGGIAIEYLEDDDAATVARMQAFDRFTVGIAPFWQGTPFRVEARLRYRVRDGKLTVWYDLVRPDVVVDEAVGDILTAVKDATGLPILHGALTQ